MAWKVEINRPHARLWGVYLGVWLAFVGCGLVLGAHLKPRADEVAFVLALPLAVLLPYALLCLGLAFMKSWAPQLLKAVQFRRFARNLRLRQHAGP